MQSVDIYMDLRRSGNEPVKGDAETAGFEGQIELWDWSWGAQLASATTGAGVDARNVEANSISICKSQDRATTPMLSLLQSGETCDKAVLYLGQTLGRAQQVTISLKGVRLMAVKFNLVNDDKEVYVDEDWTVEYDELTITHKPPSVDGEGRPTGSTAGSRVFSLRTTPGVPKAETRRIAVEPEPKATVSESDIEEQLMKLLKKHKVIK
jgi:type VI protein secretion system component Hcp